MRTIENQATLQQTKRSGGKGRRLTVRRLNLQASPWFFLSAGEATNLETSRPQQEIKTGSSLRGRPFPTKLRQTKQNKNGVNCIG
jgi:hypothetical protein